MRPAGISLRSTAPCSIPGTVMSPTYRAAPRIFSSASARSTERPTPAPVSEGGDGRDAHRASSRTASMIAR